MSLNDRTKFGSETCRCLQGHTHASKAEAGYCNFLKSEFKNKKRGWHHYSTQKTFHLVVNGLHICDHIVDFCLYDKKENILEVHEVKGFPNQAWPIKHNLFLALFPEIPYKVIKV